MNPSNDQLKDSDFNTLLKRNPGDFFEAIVLNLLWDKDSQVNPEVVAKQKRIFEQWFKYYENSVRSSIEAEIGRVFQSGHLAGRVYSLTNLPMHNVGLGKSVDLVAVTELLKLLKSEQGK